MNKAERHKVILELIARGKIARQDELAEKLRESGFEVTQASVSRDLDQLGIVKVDGSYARPELNGRGRNSFGIRSIEAAGDNLIVIRCSAGLASAAAVRIDAESFAEIVGTIAGDDTIFVAVQDRRDQKSVQKRIRSLLAS